MAAPLPMLTRPSLPTGTMTVVATVPPAGMFSDDVPFHVVPAG